jgi:hypothetical protein
VKNAAAPASLARGPDRHTHISIPLQLQLPDGWHRIEALGWNAHGFNFHFKEALEQDALCFKRGALTFEGTLAWRAPNAGEEAVQAALVNELVYKRAQSVSQDAALHARLLSLIRVQGMVPQKRRILASLGLDVDDARLARLVAKRMEQRPLFQYGVRVHAPVWSALADKAYGMSSAVLALEKWSQSLGKK